MEDITDTNRGLVNTGVPSFKRPWESTTNGFPSLDSLKADFAQRKAQILQDAAFNLGKIYLQREDKNQPLGEWALPTIKTVTGESVISFQLDAVTEKVFGAKLDTDDRFQKYSYYYDTAILTVQSKALAWALKTLGDQVSALQRFRGELEDPRFALWMHEAAQQILIRSTGCRESATAEEASRLAGMSSTGHHLPPNSEKYLDPNSDQAGADLKNASRRCLITAANDYFPDYDYVLPVPQRYVQLLKILLPHARLNKILEEYDKSAATGTKLAAQLVTEAANATAGFAKDLKIGHVWRYPAMVRGGIQELGLAGIPGFQDFVLDIAQLLAKDPLEQVLGYWGIALLVVGLFTGVGIGLTILDLALNGGTAYLSYLREHQNELAAKSSGFRSDETKFASTYGYGDTTLAAAFTLVAAISLFRPLAKLAKFPSAEKAVLKPASLVKVAGIKKEIEVVGPAGITQESRMVTPGKTAEGSKSLGKDTAVPQPPKKRQFFTVGPQKTKQAGAIADENKVLKIPESNGNTLDRATDSKVTPSDPSKSKSTARATSPAQKGLPSAPLPPNTPERIAEIGTWRQKGKLNINEGGFRLEPRYSGRTPQQFEEAVNKQIAPDFAERISNKQIRVDAPGNVGYKSPSTSKTNRLKIQKTFRGGDVIERTPDLSMEVVENIKGRGESTVEAHFFEATKNADFQAEVGFAGHKQRQASGTVFISTELARKGYRADTRLYYHFFCDKPPTETTINFLNKILDQTPNLEINWIVIGLPG